MSTRAHTCMHTAFWGGTIWWKNAERLLECDPVQTPTHFDMSASHACQAYGHTLSMHRPHRTNPTYTLQCTLEWKTPADCYSIFEIAVLSTHFIFILQKAFVFRHFRYAGNTSWKSLNTDAKSINAFFSFLLYKKNLNSSQVKHVLRAQGNGECGGLQGNKLWQIQWDTRGLDFTGNQHSGLQSKAGSTEYIKDCNVYTCVQDERTCGS